MRRRFFNLGADYSKEYFTIEVLEDGEFSIQNISNITSAPLFYSINNGEWFSTSSNINLTLQKHDKVKLKRYYNSFISNGSLQNIFSKTLHFNAEGNTMSLIYGDNFKEQTNLNDRKYVLSQLFVHSKIVSAKNLILPATTLTNSCYMSMFYGCTSLTEAPQLPATTLATDCYFMMFYNCTSLTEAPTLPATILANNCYYQMFYGCSKLNKITMLATDISATNCLSNWVSRVASSGTFVKHKDATWDVIGTSGIPNGWEVITE